jgi:hypothetical protein
MDARRDRSYFVLMESEDKKGDRWLRLGDLAPHEVIVVQCSCGRSVEYRKGFLQRRQRVPSDTLVFDLQFRLRCSHCNARAGFRITILDGVDPTFMPNPPSRHSPVWSDKVQAAI